MTRHVHEQKKILEDTAAGRLDIVVGTHKLLQPSVKFHDLGLVIVDEEHRFGVNHKEALKKMRGHVDILSMTATPIPRTLSMSFQGLRDLSIIATPPARRLSIATFLYQMSDVVVQNALERELFRGGQVYYIFNDIANIEKKVQHLQFLVPKASIGFIHGKMTELQMERVMAQFYHQRLDILVCTTIVETGIDVPSANTMLIEDAHLFGLSQLHQLRGRVGRSYHQAYAYLLVPVPIEHLPALAHTRLDVLTQYQDLGSGFHLATHDLEIRGAGELLGSQQSGHVHDIGIDLYKQLLSRARKSLEGDLAPEKTQCEIELYLNAYISEQMISDPPLRLKLYQQWERAQTIEELIELRLDFIDRFGNFDELTSNWYRVNVLRVQASAMGLERIKCSPHSFQLTLSSTLTCSDRLLLLVQKSPVHCKFLTPTCVEFKCQFAQPMKRLSALESLLAYLGGEAEQWIV
jgi:transcription-repair coupling factor (superfamily II helicase)